MKLTKWLAVVLLLGGMVYADEAAPRVAFLGVWDRSGPMLQQAAEQAGLPVVTVRVEDLAGDKAPKTAGDALAGVSVLYVLNIPAESLQALKKVLEQARTANPKLHIVELDRRDIHATLMQAGLMEADPNATAYWRPNGLPNLRRLLAYTRAKYLGGTDKIEPPEAVPDAGFFLPETPDEVAPDFSAVKAKSSWRTGAPLAAIVIHQSFWITQDTRVISAEIAALRRRGMNAVAVFASNVPQLEKFLAEIKPDLLIEDRHAAGTWSRGADGRSFLEQLDVPYLRPISMLGHSIDEWLTDPRGLAPRDLASFMSIQESAGTIEPVVVGGLKASIAGSRMHEPVGERVEHFADRAAALLRLRQPPNAQKKLAIIYYNKSLGKDDLLRGSPTGAFLDGPESLIRFLPRLQARGYAVQDIPKETKELLARIQARGRNIGPWAQGELEAEADQPGAVLIPLATYLNWFNTKLSEPLRQRVIKAHGEPPGRLMVVTRNGRPHILIPALRMGNILLAPQPERGEKMDEKLLHSRDVPPPHNYLAFYWWLQEEYKADAVVHWGTHGSLELLPGKDNGLCADDWPDICAGTLPIVNLWIMDNIGESTLARRRSYATLVDHQVPPATAAGTSSEGVQLSEDIRKFEGLQEGLVRQEFRRRITQAAIAQRLPETLRLELGADGQLSDTQITVVDEHLHLLETEQRTADMHILGQPPDPAALPSYLVKILRKSFREKLAKVLPPPVAESATPARRDAWLEHRAEALVRDCVLGQQAPPPALSDDIAFAKEMVKRLNSTQDEIGSLLHALEGRYIAPGPGPDPIRNPSSVPSGRNLYALNPEEIPTRASWEVGVQLVEEMLRTKSVKKIGVDLSGMTTMQDYGVTEAEILCLMGVRPVWDANGLAVDVELIPAAELKHPRVDVFIAMGGHYRENFGSRLRLLDKAVRLVSGLDEPDNLLRAGTLALRQRLEQHGMSAEKAVQLSTARIFGTKPGNLSGTEILNLVPRSGVWDTDDQITSVYVDSMSYAYTGEIWGQQIDGLYEQAIQGTDTIIRTWASNMTSQLSNHHCYEYLGGMSLAVKKLTGTEPQALIADVRDPSGARIRDFREVLDSNLRTELLNTDWIKGMKKHGYAGAGHVAELVKNTFGWSVTRKSDVSSGTWKEIYQTYVEDSRGLELKKWFEAENPHALQEIAATMLEASRKGYWNAEPAELQKVAELYAESVAKHGLSSGLVSGGNRKLRDLVVRQLAKAPGKEGLAKAMLAAVAKSEGGGKAGGAPDKVYGNALQQQPPAAKPPAPTATQPSATRQWTAWLALVLAALFLIGFIRRNGAIK